MTRTFGSVAHTAHVVAASWLLTVCSLAGWSVAPIVLGWQPSLVVSGSMAPRVRPGDVVLLAPLTARPHVGQVVLVRDPQAPTGRVLHRVVRITADGVLTTKGDANPTEDPTAHSTDDVLGVGRLVVPAAGRIALLLHGAAQIRSSDPVGRKAQRWALLTLAAVVTLLVTRRIQPDARP